GMPAWIQNEAFKWEEAFIEYIAARSIYDNIKSGISKEDVKNEYALCAQAMEQAEDGGTIAQISGRLSSLEYVYRLLIAVEEQEAVIAETGSLGEKHWRQYLTDKFLGDYNKAADDADKLPVGMYGKPESLEGSSAAQSYAEGSLADKFEKAEHEAAKLNDAIRLNMDSDGERTNIVMKETVDKYLSDMNAEWSEDDIEQAGYIYTDRLNIELSSLNNSESLMAVLSAEIARMGGAYEKSNSEAKMIAAMKNIETEINVLKNEYQRIMGDYAKAAENFAEKGAVYDELYTAAKKSYDEMEEARFEYEKRDAIRRWASTAYLEYDGLDAALTEQYKNPANELSYATEKLSRAEIVLAALKDVYDNGETRRPFDNAAYNDLYERYKNSFERLILSMKIKSELDAAIGEETAKNIRLYEIYTKALQSFGYPPIITENYVSLDDNKNWKLTDIITVKNGKLGFSYTGSGYVLAGQTTEKSNALATYFSANGKHETETFASSDFERALRELSGRLGAVITDETNYRQWSMARDYLIIQLQKNNGSMEELKSYYSRDAGLAGDLRTKKATFNGIKFGEVSDISMSDAYLLSLQKAAWDSLSANEKADMEFYTILTLLDAGGTNSKGFKFATWIAEYDHVAGKVKKNKNNAHDVAFASFATAAALTTAAAFLSCIPGGQSAAIALGIEAAAAGTVALFYDNASKTLSETLTELKKSLDNYNMRISDAFSGLQASTGSIKASLANYKASCDRLAKLKGETKDGSNVTWRTIKISLDTAGLNPAEISKLNSYWLEMNSDRPVESKDTVEALAQLIQWSRSEREDIKRDLENEYTEAEAGRLEKQKVYRALSQSYIAGEENIDAVKKALYDTYGTDSPAIKNHLENLESSIVNSAGGVMTSGSSYMTEFFSLAGELAEVIGRAYRARYAAELTAREVEWEQQVFDIDQKLKSWREASAVILAKGRDDWKKGGETMRARYSAWKKEFSQEYDRTSAAWDAAYLAGLEDKAAWVAEAGEAAVNASSIAALESVGASAERKARAMDTRDPAALRMSNAILETEKTLNDILQSAGILNMAEALRAAGLSAETASVAARTGVGGVNVWNAGIVRVKAAELARDSNEELAAREARMLAANFKRIALDALDGLKDYINEANRSFDESMDDRFVMEGRWSRNGGNYTNSILVDASLAGGRRESVSVEAFRYYRMEQPVNFKTDVDESRLESFDSFTVQLLIGQMREELKALQEEIFGTEEANNEYQDKNKYEKDGISAPGLFGIHRGYAPKSKEKPDVTPDTITEDNIFEHRGSGETGRLMSKYTYWKYRENFGFAAVETAAWDKKIWDDHGSFFKAPTIRSIADMAVQVVSSVAA
ncbi:MAG: hypothetical protein LBH18_01845, partial [Spirochaetaceae bacterium]|nr:hypothetical protein [Spirochaetaceae bacterium]